MSGLVKPTTEPGPDLHHQTLVLGDVPMIALLKPAAEDSAFAPGGALRRPPGSSTSVPLAGGCFVCCFCTAGALMEMTRHGMTRGAQTKHGKLAEYFHPI